MTVGSRKNVEVVAAVIEFEGRLLCVQRGPNPRAYIAGKWEFPGGKVEPGEDQVSALVREIDEELRIPISVGRHLVSVNHEYPDFDLRMHAFLCTPLRGTTSMVLTEHVAFRWLDPRDPGFRELDWAAADLPIVELLRIGSEPLVERG